MLLGPALAISAVLFTLGVAGVLLRRNAIVIFMCVELMLNAVNLTFVALAQRLGIGGQVFVFFVMAVAAAEAAVGLAIILAVYRPKQAGSLQNMTPRRGGCPNGCDPLWARAGPPPCRVLGEWRDGPGGPPPPPGHHGQDAGLR